MGKPVHKVKSIAVIVLLVGILLPAVAQKHGSSSFYRHFTGKLDTTMQISLDLLFRDGKITGSYYYYFPEPGNKKNFYYGKTIPVYGTLDGDNVTLNEFSDNGSGFKGILEKKGKMFGTWQRKAGEKSIPFSIEEDYSNGSLPFTCYTLSTMRYLIKGKNVDKNSPKATINLVLLYPNLPSKNRLKDSLDILITRLLYVDTVPFKNPELLLENITFDFFKSYYNATDGIENIESKGSFNWEKNVSMDIYYNERKITSLKIEKYAYTGGAHGIAMTQYVVCDLKQYKRLWLHDIMIENYELRLNALLNEKLRKLNGIKPEEKLNDAGFFDEIIETSENFYINKDGIGFFYNLYQIAPYSAGTTDLFLTFKELKEVLDPTTIFFWNQPGNEITGKLVDKQIIP
jgi:hypothetical protein